MSKPQKTGTRRIHDFFYDRPFLFNLLAYAPSTGPLYNAWRVFWYLLAFMFQTMAWTAFSLVYPDKELMISALHFQLLSTFGLWGLSSRLLTHKSLSKVREMVLQEVYIYPDEEIDAEEEDLRNSISDEIKNRSKLALIAYSFGALCNMILFPISQIFVAHESTVELDNPYLPYLLYVPFDTYNFFGYAAAYLIRTFILLYVYGLAVCMNETYLSCVTHLKTHLKILNRSLKNIQQRALKKFKRYNSVADIAQIDLTENREYQNCLYLCLKANIRHHQKLLLFKELSQPTVGAFVIGTMILSMLSHAIVLYLIMRKPPINVAVNQILTLIVEQTYGFCLCYFGEEIITEATILFENLYDLSWMNYNYKFKQSLHIMMSNTFKPLKMQATLLDYCASLESYGDLLSTMYKVMSLMRQSDI